MADVIQIDLGYSPWRPSRDAVLVKQYQYYEIPLSGVVSQHGVRYYFDCALGGDEDVNFWVYFRLDEATERRLDDAEVEEASLINLGSGPAVLAAALTGVGIVAYETFNAGDHGSLQPAMEAISERLRNWSNTASELVSHQPA